MCCETKGQGAKDEKPVGNKKIKKAVDPILHISSCHLKKLVKFHLKITNNNSNGMSESYYTSITVILGSIGFESIVE